MIGYDGLSEERGKTFLEYHENRRTDEKTFVIFFFQIEDVTAKEFLIGEDS